MDSGHSITCKCGENFKTSEEHTRHVAIQEVLEEVKRIGGEKFYRQAKAWGEDAHSGDLQEFTANHDLELKPENATRIAKKELIYMIRHHDEHHLDQYNVGGNE